MTTSVHNSFMYIQE